MWGSIVPWLFAGSGGPDLELSLRLPGTLHPHHITHLFPRLQFFLFLHCARRLRFDLKLRVNIGPSHSLPGFAIGNHINSDDVSGTRRYLPQGQAPFPPDARRFSSNRFISSRYSQYYLIPEIRIYQHVSSRRSGSRIPPSRTSSRSAATR